MHSEKLQAFVLSSLDYGDSDRIVSLFTLEHGRIKAFARGARKSRKRFGGTGALPRIELTLQVKEGFRLQQADINRIYPGLRDSLEISPMPCTPANWWMQSPRRGTHCRASTVCWPPIWTVWKRNSGPSDRRFFEINLLNILGYRPPLEAMLAPLAQLPADW